MKIKKICISLFLTIVILCSIGCGVYLHDYYHASDSALLILDEIDPDISITNIENKQIIFAPNQPKAGLIFYPGGKVQYESYAPLMEELAKRDILCVLVHMPGNLAVLDINAADGIQDAYPEIKNWFLAGHSLGGSMASAYLENHTDSYDGLVLLASYSTKDLSSSGVSVLSIYGSEDQVLNRESYQKYKTNLPKDTEEYVIDGGCHAYFGDYGAQDGDGIPTISPNEQVIITADYIEDFLL